MRLLPALLLLAACSSGPGNEAANSGGPAAPEANQAGRNCHPGDYDNGCADFAPAERLRGVWVWGGPGQSDFIVNATAAPPRDSVGTDRAWLSFVRDFPSDAAVAERTQRDGVAAYAIEFDGRRAAAPGPYGPGGRVVNLVVVDRIVSMRVLEWPAR